MNSTIRLRSRQKVDPHRGPQETIASLAFYLSRPVNIIAAAQSGTDTVYGT